MKVVFRVDASVEIGSGHLMRCMTLADALSSIADILFVCRSLLPKFEQLLRNRGYGIQLLPFRSVVSVRGDLTYSHWLGTSQAQDVLDTKNVISAFGECDWLVVDHYSLDYRFETPLRDYVGNILIIDDLADRRHDCDLLIDQNLYENIDTRYEGKVPEHCRCLLGMRYCFLRNEFLQFQNRVPRSGPVRSVLIYFGGVDSSNRTQEAVQAVLSAAGSEIAIGRLQVNVVVGSTHPAIDVLQEYCLRYRMGFHVQTNEMAKLMAEADLAIGAGGISTFERLYMRLPALLTPIADNQIAALRFMSTFGFFKLYENRQNLEDLLRKSLNSDNVSPPDCVENGIPLLVQAMRQGVTRLKSPTALDIRRTFYWLQDKALRRDFELAESPVRKQHFYYWRKLMADNSQRVLAINYEGRHVGNCGLKNIDVINSMCELWIYIGEANMRGKGVAKLALMSLKHLVKNELHIRSIYLHVAIHNLPAIRLYRSAGFVESKDRLLPPWKNRDTEIKKMVCVL